MKTIKTDKELINEAAQYATIKELRCEDIALYNYISRRKLQNRAYAHIDRARARTDEELIKMASKYDTQKEMKKDHSSAFTQIERRGLKKIAFAHMVSAKMKWTDDELFEIAQKYKTASELRISDNGAECAIRRRNIEEKCFAHFLDTHTRKNFGLILEPRTSGIYCLYVGDILVYIGKSNSCLSTRIASHTRSTDNEYKKEVDKVIIYEVNNNADIDIAEVYLINKLKPVLNIDCKQHAAPTLVIQNLDDVIEKTITAIKKDIDVWIVE